MKLLIDIPEHIYEHAKEMSEDSRDEGEAMRAIANGTQQESRSEIPNTCEDAISRQAVLDATVNKNSIWNMITNSKGENLEEIISQLPSVSPQQRTGRQIGMTEEELMKKIEKEEKWLIHALNDQTDATSSYSVDIALDAVKHYVKDYINSQQKEVEECAVEVIAIFTKSCLKSAKAGCMTQKWMK
jgi:hypothetical protein